MSSMQSRPALGLITGLALAAAVFAGPAQARIYKWTDDDGNTVYSQNPPPAGTKAERIKEAPPPADDPEKVMESLRQRVEALENSEEESEESAAQSEAEAERAARQKEVCEQLRKNLEVMQTNNQVREQDDDGEYTVLSEEQRQARLKSTRERIEKECGN